MPSPQQRLYSQPFFASAAAFAAAWWWVGIAVRSTHHLLPAQGIKIKRPKTAAVIFRYCLQEKANSFLCPSISRFVFVSDPLPHNNRNSVKSSPLLFSWPSSRDSRRVQSHFTLIYYNFFGTASKKKERRKKRVGQRDEHQSFPNLSSLAGESILQKRRRRQEV